MPTWDQLQSFRQDLKNLTPAQRKAFKKAVAKFVADLRAAKFRKSLRVKKMSGRDDIWEMTWAPDGRATPVRRRSAARRTAHRLAADRNA